MDKELICTIDTDLLEDYVDNCLGKPEKLLIETHMRSCLACRKHVSELKLLFWELDRAAKEPVYIPDDISLLGINIRRAAAEDSIKKGSSMHMIFTTSADVLKNSFSFTRYVIPSIRSDVVKSYGHKLKYKAAKAGRSYLKRQITGLMGGKV
jgi:predicted anti-sigma-YlaC factor YlaD